MVNSGFPALFRKRNRKRVGIAPSWSFLMTTSPFHRYPSPVHVMLRAARIPDEVFAVVRFS
jgi:hypothetical protein